MNKRVKIVEKYAKIILIVLSLVLVTKLLWVCVYNYNGFKLLSENQITIKRSQALPRGKILDKNGNVFAQDRSRNTLSYIESGRMDTEAKEELAKKIASLIEIPDTSVNQVDLEDFVLSKNQNLNNILKSISDDERKQISNMSDNDYNNFLRSKLSGEQKQEVINNYTPEELYIILKMRQATANKSVSIKDEVTDQEFYNISLISNQCGGFYLDKTYVREYPQGQVMRSFIGSFGNIPEEQLDAYLNQGYSQDAKVGTSYLELELEQTLRSIDQQIEMVFDTNGNIKNNIIKSEGSRGSDVYLTIDLETQKLIEDNLTSYLEGNTYELAKNVYATIVNPDNGDLVAIGGKTKLDDGSIGDNAIGNFTQSYTLGSTIKPAILSLGYDSKVWEYDEVVNDEPWYILGTPKKASHTNMGPINEYEAISYSSNIYFYSVLLKYAGTSYQPNQPLNIDPVKFNEVRNWLAQYGLGSSTGIDVNNETIGIEGGDTQAGLYLDLANGQYDTYTNLQQTQYAATIEDLGTRYKINYIDHIVKPAVNSEENKLVYEAKPEVLNKVDISTEDAMHVRDTMDKAISANRSTVRSKGFKLSKRLSAKTGTSESFYFDPNTHILTKTNTTSFIGTYEGVKQKYTIGVVIPDYTSAGNSSQRESGHVAANILNTMERNNA